MAIPARLGLGERRGSSSKEEAQGLLWAGCLSGVRQLGRLGVERENEVKDCLEVTASILLLQHSVWTCWAAFCFYIPRRFRGGKLGGAECQQLGQQPI